ncbi:MAG: Cysteine desulfurase NifS [Opitutia bacterium UBA7350]|nr:MAG: Cysteine desulfurase NifS [Opitutae bacterium UBA7350]
MKLEFFDNNSTTPLSLAGMQAWEGALAKSWLNPSSPYRAAAKVRAHLEAAREKLAALLDAKSERVVFNSGATEGNNCIFKMWASELPRDARVGVSPTEHPSVLEAAQHYFGERVTWLPLDPSGAVAVDSIAYNALGALSVMAANNETGVLNPWEKLAENCGAAGIPYHCDASQWLGKLPAKGLGACDYLTGCAHKFGGPKGTGFLLLAEGKSSAGFQIGGPQENGHRAGTEDVPAVLSMLAALESTTIGDAAPRDAFESGILSVLPGCEVVGIHAERLWNTSAVLLPEFENVRWIRALEKRGFLISTGSACASGKAGASPVLSAMGYGADTIRRVVRISGSATTDSTAWDALRLAFVESYAALKKSAGDSPVVTI